MSKLIFDNINPLCSFGYSIKILKPKEKQKYLWKVYKGCLLVFEGTYEEFLIFSSDTVCCHLEEMFESV